MKNASLFLLFSPLLILSTFCSAGFWDTVPDAELDPQIEAFYQRQGEIPEQIRVFTTYDLKQTLFEVTSKRAHSFDGWLEEWRRNGSAEARFQGIVGNLKLSFHSADLGDLSYKYSKGSVCLGAIMDKGKTWEGRDAVVKLGSLYEWLLARYAGDCVDKTFPEHKGTGNEKERIERSKKELRDEFKDVYLQYKMLRGMIERILKEEREALAKSPLDPVFSGENYETVMGVFPKVITGVPTIFTYTIVGTGLKHIVIKPKAVAYNPTFYTYFKTLCGGDKELKVGMTSKKAAKLAVVLTKRLLVFIAHSDKQEPTEEKKRDFERVSWQNRHFSRYFEEKELSSVGN